MFGDEIAVVVTRLSSHHEAEREAADRQLRSLSPSDIDNLLTWSRSSDAGQSVGNLLFGCTATGCGISGALSLVIGISVLVNYGEGAIIAFLVGALGLAGAFALVRAIKGREFQVESAALSRVEDPAAAGPILRHLLKVERTVRLASSDALLRLLPRVKASDTAWFPPSVLNAMHGLLVSDLGYQVSTNVLLAVLDTLQQVGNESSVRALRQLLKQPVQNARDSRIHAAARPVLEALENRLQEQHQATTLLRAAGQASPESLLRPSAARPGEEPEALLRPADGADGT